MSVRSWVLHRVQGIGAAAGRPDLPVRDSRHGREPELDGGAGAARAATSHLEPAPVDFEHLGGYAPLVGAIRDELEHFVASQLRLHVAIADRDRFILTALGVRSPGGDAARDLYRRFVREFKPEQVKRYLAREVIGRLPHASAIDLSQFAGLTDLDDRRPAEEDDEYAELIAALRIEPPSTAQQRPFEISVIGRWTERDSPISPVGTSPAARAADRIEFHIEDADGRRRVALNAVLPGRRFVIGKADGAEIRVNGAYTSRRHAELWLDGKTWRIVDLESTNGLRVESATGQTLAVSGGDRAGAAAIEGPSAAPIELRDGVLIVLSARAEGPPGEYPRLRVQARALIDAVPPTPIAGALGRRATADNAASSVPSTLPMIARRTAPATPRTAVLDAKDAGSRTEEAVFEITEPHADGDRVHALRPSELPITIGRSRGQTIVIDGRHRGVSGHHVDIESIDDDVAVGIVRGDNGVEVDGAHHATGETFRWPLGRTLVLGGSLPGEPRCELTLSKRTEASR